MRAQIVRKDILNKDTFSIWFLCKEIAKKAKPGQFVQIRVEEGFYPFLPRPFSISDTQRDLLRIVFKIRGMGTSILSRKEWRDFLEIFGPLGRPCPLPKRGKILLIAGGIGIAPIPFFARIFWLMGENRKADLFFGAKTKKELVILNEIRGFMNRVEITTEDGSLGKKGVVTDLLKGERYDTIFACGPMGMLKKIKELNLPSRIYGFFEERMGCGAGLCFCCALKRAKGGYFRVCRDGPVFDLKEIAF